MCVKVEQTHLFRRVFSAGRVGCAVELQRAVEVWNVVVDGVSDVNRLVEIEFSWVCSFYQHIILV